MGTQDADLSLPTFHVVVYNKGLVLSTNQNVSPDGSSFRTYDGTTAPENWAPTSFQTAQYANTYLGMMKHAVLLNRATLTKADLQANLPKATAFFAQTHGTFSAFLTYGNAGPPATQYGAISFVGGVQSELGQIVAQGRTVPPVNLAILHACQVIGFNDDIVRAFLQTNDAVTDRAFAGFQHVVDSHVVVFQNGQETGTLTTIDQHARKIYALLAQGFTIGQAIAQAEGIYKTRTRNSDGTYSYEPMKVGGDDFTRLTSVFTGTDSKAPTDWYLFR